MDEFLSSVSSSLVLSTDENTIFTHDANPSNDSPAPISLLLKLHIVKPFNRPSLMETLSGICSSQCRFHVCLSEHADGLFMVTFGCEGDKGRILEGQPWHFAQMYGIHFMCKSHELARFIASEVGDLIEVDRDTVREGVGPYLRLRILLDVNLPIRSDINIRFIRMGREFIKWLDFCFYCGRLDHTKRYCHAFLQKCDETLSEPLCPFTILLRGKEKISDKSVSFQYPHPPAITLLDIPPVDLNILARGSLGPTIRFPSFFTNQVTSGFHFTPSHQSVVVMIPTPLNPNVGGMIPPFGRSGISSSSNPSSFTSYSTDFILVADRTNLACFESMRDAFPTQINTPAPSCGGLALGSNTMELEVGALTGQPDPSVKGKSLASASGVKRPSFQTHQAVVGGSLRSTLKRACAGDNEDGSSATTLEPEQTGDAEHTRPEKLVY
uniref:Zinc knuckle CX2CX4HX4C domain-containing protein n=1 Tax=Cannabis sativa TaxID=3483 RepID=A0A803QPY7_CANSA